MENMVFIGRKNINTGQENSISKQIDYFTMFFKGYHMQYLNVDIFYPIFWSHEMHNYITSKNIFKKPS